MYDIIFNPVSAKGKSRAALNIVEGVLQSKSIPYTVHETQYQGHAKELAAAQVAGQPLTPEEAERLEASRSRKKNAYQELKAQAETDPAAAAELARRRAYHSEATKKSRQKMYEEAAAGNPAAQARYENFLAARRENYHRKKHDEKGEQIA